MDMPPPTTVAEVVQPDLLLIVNKPKPTLSKTITAAVEGEQSRLTIFIMPAATAKKLFQAALTKKTPCIYIARRIPVNAITDTTKITSTLELGQQKILLRGCAITINAPGNKGFFFNL